MTKSWWIGTLLAAALIATGIAYLTAFMEPVYQDRPLSNWLARLRGPSEEARDEAREAITAIGQEAIPHLVWWLGDEDSDLEKRLRKLLDQQSWLNYKRTTAQARRTRARLAFRALGPAGGPAVPQLIPLLSDRNFRVRQAAARSPGYIGKDARDAIPDLIRLTGDPNKFRAVFGGANGASASQRLRLADSCGRSGHTQKAGNTLRQCDRGAEESHTRNRHRL